MRLNEIVVMAIGWGLFLALGIVLTRYKREPWASITHLLSAACCFGLLSALAVTVNLDSRTIGWCTLLALPLAAVINLTLTWAASTRWPHCKRDGTRLSPSKETIPGTDGPGFATAMKCPRCGYLIWRD